MKRTLIAAAFTAALLAGSVEAKEKSKGMGRFEVPFEFTVHNTQMPAGQYQLINDGQSFVTVRNVETGRSVYVIRQAGTPQGSRKLVFKEQSGELVLVKVG